MRTIGALMLLAALSVLFTRTVIETSWKYAVAVWIIALLFVGWIAVGTNLLTGG